MTTLPSNLARVGEDLARATLQDARRSRKRRRLVAFAIAFALLALSASAAIATGWLSEKTPAVQAVPLLERPGVGTPRLLMSNLGSARRTLTAVTTASGAVCLTLSGYTQQCVSAFLVKQQLSFFVWSTRPGGPAVISGIVRDAVVAVDAISSGGQATRAQLANDAFFLELPGLPTKLIAHLDDGTSVTRAVAPCSPTTPDCVP